MRYLFALILYSFVTQSQAAIYVCQDQQQRKTYQDEPCTTQTVGQLAHVPDASLEDQMRVQDSIRLANERYINRMQKLKDEQLAQLEYEKRLLALEVEKRKLLALEQEEQASPQVIVYNRWRGGYGNGYINHPYRPHQHVHQDQFDDVNSHWPPNQHTKPNFLVRGTRSQGLSVNYSR
jgi:hypothetical protein